MDDKKINLKFDELKKNLTDLIQSGGGTINDATITITQGGVTKGSFTTNQSSNQTIALDSGGGSVSIDNDSITNNASNQIQAVGVIDSKTENANKQWTGTLAEYNAIVTKDNNTFYHITDDLTSILPVATTSSPGVVKADGTTITIANDGTISSVQITENTVSGWGFTKNAGTYSKPVTGIPNNDLSDEVKNKQTFIVTFSGNTNSLICDKTYAQIAGAISQEREIIGKYDDLNWELQFFGVDDEDNLMFYSIYLETTHQFFLNPSNVCSYEMHLLASASSIIGKLSVSDTVNNLTSTYVQRPLSANMGKTLKDLVDLKQDNNLVTSISSASTDSQYPSAKCVYDMVGDIETVLTTLTSGNGV